MADLADLPRTTPQPSKSTAIRIIANILVAAFMLSGVWMLYDGLGVDFSILDYPGLDPYATPIGILLLCLAALTAQFWIFNRKQRGEGDDRQQPAPSSSPSSGFVPGRQPTPSSENTAPTIAFQNQAAPSRQLPNQHTLDAYDVTALVGLRAVAHNGAVEAINDEDEVRIVVPHLEELRAAAAVMRCLLPIRLRGAEIAAIRKIAGLRPTDLAKQLGDETSPTTICRWESEELSMSEPTEKRFRVLVCEQVGPKASHVQCDSSKIANFRIVDPWSGDPSYEVPPVVLNWIVVKDRSGSITSAWDDKWAA